MSELDPAQTEIAHLLFGLPEAAGYALAGGGALIVNGTIERPTRDIDRSPRHNQPNRMAT